jgi:hypothetical protein
VPGEHRSSDRPARGSTGLSGLPECPAGFIGIRKGRRTIVSVRYVEFSREAIENLPAEARRVRLAQLGEELTVRLRAHADSAAYWREVGQVIDDLKAVGHDLWSHDYDGQRRMLWGWDYMQPEIAGQLQIQFDHQGAVKVFWRTENPQLAAGEEEE